MSTDPMAPRDPMSHNGAVWCGEHRRWECSKRSKRTGVRCHSFAIRGLDRCVSHAGESTEVAKARGQANLDAVAFGRELSEFANPTDVLLWSVTVSWARARFLAGLLGDRYADRGLSAMVVVSERGEQVSGLAVLEAAERDRALSASSKALTAGCEERRVRLAEQQGDLLNSGLRWLMAELGLGSDAEADRLVGVMLAALAAGRAPAVEAGGAA